MANLTVTPIIGAQLTLLPGETIATSSGSATVTRTETAGNKQIIWADYGSGFEQPHISESLLSPEQQSSPTAAERQRRYSAKGHACGWIEERLGNIKRKNPSTSYYYCWQDGETRGKQYVPVRKMATVQQMLSDRRSVDDILAVLKK
jgi:hypothetical protein